jgi:hypothetical protein
MPSDLGRASEVKLRESVQSADLPLLAKLGSIAAHVEEAMSIKGHPLDRYAVEALLADPDVQKWMDDMRELGLLPVPR